MGLFGKSKPPKEQVNEWCHKIRKEGYTLDRQIRGIQREEEKVKRSLREAAKKGDKDVCLILAKELLRSRKAINRIHVAKANLNSIQMQMKNQLATLRVAGAMQRSTEVMQGMQQLIRMPEISATMQEMSREMMKAGIIEEMMEETMEDALGDTDEMEEEAQEEVDKILWEVTAGALGRAPAAVSDSLPVPSAAAAEKRKASAGSDEEADDITARLEALKS
ncbi:unnamed protein product [Cyprideis torosa]|uniref:Charged multivesicular body protein 3 n=1 Tax=Cyprideis torosa TaxID=163714 RepID=A0A7R8ZIZ3_9CRUS|nr:unnamed protein product [Cyprideis torosa]CAG0881133.1 unnamed protein product [Cyprideis torosa]